MEPLRIINERFELLGETSNYLSFINEVSYNGIGTCEIRVSNYDKQASKFQIDNIVFLTDQTDEAYIIKRREIELNENGKASEIWVITGYQLKYIVNRAIIYPPQNSDYREFVGNAESAIHYYVDTQLINTASDRIFPNLVLGQNMNRGQVRNYSARYENLSDFITNVALADSLGWDIVLDLVNEKFVLVVTKGSDRTIDSENPIILSTDFNTLKQMDYSESKVDLYNVVLVGGPGSGLDRIIVEVGDAQGSERREIFVDARNIPLKDENNNDRTRQQITDDLIQYGREYLIKSNQMVFASGQLQPRNNLQFKRNYNVGDKVTIQNKSWGVQLDATITKVKKGLQPGLDIIEHTFDNDIPNIISKIKDSLNNINNEVRK